MERPPATPASPPDRPPARTISAGRKRGALKSAQKLKTEHMQIRITRDLKALVTEVAALLGTSVSDFSTRVIRQAAQDELLSQRLITLKSADFDHFVAQLEQPPKIAKSVKARLRRRAVWDVA